jgi:acyl-CoA thioester hydrolase
MAWKRTLSLRYQDVDYLGHVTTTAYLALFEESRMAWLADTWSTRFPPYVVVCQELHYVHEVLLEDDPLTISAVPVRLGRSSFDIEESLFAAGGECKSRSRATLVAWDTEARHARPMTDTERSALAAQCETPTAAWPNRQPAVAAETTAEAIRATSGSSQT